MLLRLRARGVIGFPVPASGNRLAGVLGTGKGHRNQAVGVKVPSFPVFPVHLPGDRKRYFLGLVGIRVARSRFFSSFESYRGVILISLLLLIESEGYSIQGFRGLQVPFREPVKLTGNTGKLGTMGLKAA